jgi:hypothetical protein
MCRYTQKGELTMHDPSLAAHAKSGALPWMLLGAVILIWGAGVLTLAEAGAFRQPPGEPPFRLMAGIVVPVLIGVLTWRLLPAIRAWTESWDLATLVGMQTFRVAGVVFLFFWWIGTLPTLFAWVGAVGDIAVGILAIPTTIAVAQKTAGWQAKVRRLTFFGILDFATVLIVGTLSQEGRILQFAGEPAPSAMQVMPMIMIPGFLVPMFILLLLLQRQRAKG